MVNAVLQLIAAAAFAAAMVCERRVSSSIIRPSSQVCGKFQRMRTGVFVVTI
jgi:hypothetical protein